MEKALAEIGPIGACRWSLEPSANPKNQKGKKKVARGTSKPGRPAKAKVEKPAKPEKVGRGRPRTTTASASRPTRAISFVPLSLVPCIRAHSCCSRLARGSLEQAPRTENNKNERECKEPEKENQNQTETRVVPFSHFGSGSPSQENQEPVGKTMLPLFENKTRIATITSLHCLAARHLERWNEPNHTFELKQRKDTSVIRRGMVATQVFLLNG